jgi:hypothetical protein
MYRRYSLLIACSAALVPLAVAVALYLLRQAGTPPQTLEDLARIAHRAGLFHRSDLADGHVAGRLVVSERPVSYERANRLRIGQPEHGCWDGTVAATVPSNAYVYNEDDQHTAVWGSVLLYGDPALIRRLMTTAGTGFATCSTTAGGVPAKCDARPLVNRLPPVENGGVDKRSEPGRALD